MHAPRKRIPLPAFSLSLFLLDGAAQLYVLFASAFLFVRLWRFAFGKKRLARPTKLCGS
jgi:hypothetical protein